MFIGLNASVLQTAIVVGYICLGKRRKRKSSRLKTLRDPFILFPIRIRDIVSNLAAVASTAKREKF